MNVHLDLRNESSVRQPCRRDTLARLAERVCADEGVQDTVELSVLFCDDAFIAGLNQTYRSKEGPTDVLSFGQEVAFTHGLRVLGDIVISLETVARFCGGEREAMGAEVRLLFCHPLLHLLGYTHGSAADQTAMQRKQADYLEIAPDAAWRTRPARR